jgi:outer membrane receptor protein involved in Fe transport
MVPALPILFAAAMVSAQMSGPQAITGTVRDSTGQVVAGATVVARTPAGVERRAVTGGDGRFSVARPAEFPVTLIVVAAGFGEARHEIASGGAMENLDLLLLPAAVSETVSVTAYRVPQRLQDVAASVNVLSQEDIRRSPAVVADDVLRQVPTFSLFRRTSSLASHPTAQGVSLRGLGPSGVSRTLVLLDGVPFNDPFGGWVYWTRVPLNSADSIEVVDSSSSSLYGNYAMGGVINIITARPAPRRLDLKGQYGNRNSPKAEVMASDVWGKVGLFVDGATFSTDGYPIVVETNPAGVPERGRVDKNASVEFGNVNVKLDYTGSPETQASFRVGYFREDRINGKASTIDGTDEQNDTRWTSLSGGVRRYTARSGTFDANLFVDAGKFRSNFLAVPATTPPRNVGRMTLNQVVPSNAVGSTLHWSLALGGRHTLGAGVDWRWVDGDSEENALDPVSGTQVTLERISGGTQRSLGAFVQDIYRPTDDLTITVSARIDNWRNYEAHNLETLVPSGTPTAGHNPSLPGREDTVASPRMAARYKVSDRISIWGDVGAGFRAPTLNELYRQFRVGTVLTLANHQLGPERLVGGEVGATFMPARNVMLRTTYFDNRVKDPVSNVTIAAAGANVTQQRQNLGRTRIRGLQNDVELRVGSSWRFTGGYLYEHAKVSEFAANPLLVGNDLPQVPRHRGSIQAAYANPRFATVAVALQAVGRQFDDDLNVRRVPGLDEPGLPGYALLSITASRNITRNVDAFFGIQNTFDEEYFVGTLPTTVGSPRLVTAGVRVRFAGGSR